MATDSNALVTSSHALVDQKDLQTISRCELTLGDHFLLTSSDALVTSSDALLLDVTSSF